MRNSLAISPLQTSIIFICLHFPTLLQCHSVLAQSKDRIFLEELEGKNTLFFIEHFGISGFLVKNDSQVALLFVSLDSYWGLV